MPAADQPTVNAKPAKLAKHQARKECLRGLSGLCVLSSRKLVWIVREERVDAERVKEVRHLVADAGEAGLLVRAMMGIIMSPSANPPASALNCLNGSTATT